MFKKIFTAGCLVTAACTATTVTTDAPSEMTAAEGEALYMKRFNALRDKTGATGLPAYDNLKPVAGAEDWKPLPKSEDPYAVVSKDALDAAIDYASKNNTFSLMVWKDGEMISETYFGETTETTPLVSKSLAKPLGVVAVGRAIKLGYIDSLDQSMSDFITEWKGTPKEAIRIRDVLGMHSGLLPQAAAFEPDNVLNRAYLHPFHDRVIIEDYPMVTEPGETYAYSNANGDLVAPLIERATGMRYGEWLTTAIFEPLGAQGGEIWMNRDGGVPHAGCCILLPADTFMRLAIVLVQDGEWKDEAFLSEAFVEEIKKPGPDYANAGMGVYLGTPYKERLSPTGAKDAFSGTLQTEPYLADDLFSFDGNSNQIAYMVPSENLVIFRMGTWPPKEPEWDNSYLANVILKDLQD